LVAFGTYYVKVVEDTLMLSPTKV